MADKETTIKLVLDTADAAKSIKDIKKSIKELEDATSDIEIGSDDFVKLSKRTEELKDQLKGLGSTSKDTQGGLMGMADSVGNLPGPLGQASSGVAGLSKQFVTLLANPVVLVIAAIVGAIVLLYKSFTKTEEGGNKVNKVFTVLNGVFSGFLKAIKPIAEFIVDNLVKGFEELGKILGVVGDSVTKFIGYFSSDAEKKIREFANAVGENVKASLQLADAENKLTKANRESRKEQLLGQIEAEKLRQIRDDESKTIGERIEANKKLGQSLDNQLQKELALAQTSLDVAKLRQKIDGDTTQVLDEIAEAETNLIDINERILGQKSEQLANENALRREAQQAAEERRKIREQERRDLMKLEEDDLNNRMLKNQQELDLLMTKTEAKKEYDDDYFLNQIDKSDEVAVYNDWLADIELKKKKLAAEEAVLIKQAETDATLGMASMAIGAITANMEEGSEAGKALAVTQTTIDTWRGAQAAYASAQANPISIIGPAYPGIMAGIAVAFGLANVRKILSTPKATKGSTPSAPSGGFSAPSSPNINPATLFPTQQLEGAETETVSTGGPGQRQQVIKAVVSERDVTNVQNRISNYERMSEIG